MIELTVTNFFVMLVLVPFVLCGLGGAWRRVSECRARSAARRASMRCRYCSAPFLRAKSLQVEICPRCHAENQAGRDRRMG